MVIDEAYGLTETGLVIVSPPAGQIKLGSVGQPAPGVALSVRGESGTTCRPAMKGACGSGPERPLSAIGLSRTRRRLYSATGGLIPGISCQADDEGYYYFCGRRKQIIVHDGSNICPQEVEDALLEHPGLQCAAVVGIHDPVHGENVRAYITLQPGAPRPRRQELVQFARARVGYKAPEEIVILEEMPRTADGKVDRTAVKRMAEVALTRDRGRAVAPL